MILFLPLLAACLVGAVLGAILIGPEEDEETDQEEYGDPVALVGPSPGGDLWPAVWKRRWATDEERSIRSGGIGTRVRALAAAAGAGARTGRRGTENGAARAQLVWSG